MISVIGAGPSGCFYASKEKREDVHIFEEHKEIGRPVACTGILTSSVKDIINIKEDLIINKIKNFKITAPNRKSIFVKLKRNNLILDRAKFDQYLLEKAIDNGAKLHLNEKFLDYYNNIITTTKRRYRVSSLIGADGPLSNVAKSVDLYKGRKFLTGIQARVKIKDLEEDTAEVKLGIGEFSWIVPEDNKTARIGVIGNKKDFEKLIKGYKIIEHQNGIVPLYNPKQKLKKDNVFLLGDAATQVKATTYGGILYGLHAGKLLAENKDNYEKNFKKFKKELKLSLRLRKMMNSMDESNYNELVRIFNKERNKEILERYDRDYPSKIILKLLKEYKLWKLSLKLMKNGIGNR